MSSKSVQPPPIKVPASRVNQFGDPVISDTHLYDTTVVELGDPFEVSAEALAIVNSPIWGEES